MNNLVQKLKDQHQKLLVHIYNFAKPFLKKEERAKIFDDFKKDVVEHIDIEDKELYFVLYREAEKDNELKSTLETFAAEMEHITDQIFVFFEKYKNIDNINTAFEVDYNLLVSLLKQRIRREENILYFEYEKILNNINQV